MTQRRKVLARTIATVFLATALLCLGGIHPGYAKGTSEPIKRSDTDYSVPAHWLQFADRGLGVDFFAIYPTVTASEAPEDLPFVRLNSDLMHQAAMHWLAQSADLISAGNVYAPLYRQLNGVELSRLDSSGFESYTLATPRDDVFTAFDYFLKNINKNERPFVLIGHSQGAALVAECAARMLGAKEYESYNKNHVATYAVGYSVTPKQVALNPHLRFSDGPDATGVILSWNTTSPQEVATRAYEHFGTWNPEALNTNPINWKSDATPATTSENLASKLPRADGNFIMTKAYADAVVDNERRVLVTSSVPENEYTVEGIPVGKYHRYDILFFYDSIKKNIADRIAAFEAKH